MSEFEQAWQTRKAVRGNGCNPKTEFKAGWEAAWRVRSAIRGARASLVVVDETLTTAALSEPQTLSAGIKPLPSETAPAALTGLQGPTVAITQNRQVGITIESRPASEIPDRDKSAPTVLQGACGNCRTVNVGDYCDCKCHDWKEH